MYTPHVITSPLPVDIWKACLDGVGDRDDGGLSYVGVLHQHALNLRRGHQVPGAVQHVVNTSCHRVPAVRAGSRSKWQEKKVAGISSRQGCEWTDKSANRERESITRIGSDASFFWVSLSNLVIDDNFRISHNLGLGLAANISTALPIQPVRDREIEIILWFF